MIIFIALFSSENWASCYFMKLMPWSFPQSSGAMCLKRWSRSVPLLRLQCYSKQTNKTTTTNIKQKRGDLALKLHGVHVHGEVGTGCVLWRLGPHAAKSTLEGLHRLILIYAHRDRIDCYHITNVIDGKPRTSTSSFTQLLSSEGLEWSHWRGRRNSGREQLLLRNCKESLCSSGPGVGVGGRNLLGWCQQLVVSTRHCWFCRASPGRSVTVITWDVNFQTVWHLVIK